MKRNCPNSQCPSVNDSSPSGHIVRFGSYYRASDSRWIPRFKCKRCHRTFSSATHSPAYGQKKRRVNHRLKILLCSGVSQRRSAMILGVNPKTVVRKFLFLAAEAKRENVIRRGRLFEKNLEYIQFDDLETSEHSKCKPLSVALAVEPATREILTFHVSRMPAKGHLAAIARAKYGPRPDERPTGWASLMEDLRPLLSARVRIVSDENPHYPRFIKRYFPESCHAPVKGRRGCVAGQGELKKIGFDPLFSLNHSCAMLRANINRLFRRTWCTTKLKERLEAHIDLYVNFHNQRLIPESSTG